MQRAWLSVAKLANCFALQTTKKHWLKAKEKLSFAAASTVVGGNEQNVKYFSKVFLNFAVTTKGSCVCATSLADARTSAAAAAAVSCRTSALSLLKQQSCQVYIFIATLKVGPCNGPSMAIRVCSKAARFVWHSEMKDSHFLANFVLMLRTGLVCSTENAPVIFAFSITSLYASRCCIRGTSNLPVFYL